LSKLIESTVVSYAIMSVWVRVPFITLTVAWNTFLLYFTCLYYCCDVRVYCWAHISIMQG